MYDRLTSSPFDLGCTSANPDLFFPDDRKELREAQELCAACPFKALCLDLGQEERRTGVWGGRYIKDGRIMERPFNGRYREALSDQMARRTA